MTNRTFLKAYTQIFSFLFPASLPPSPSDSGVSSDIDSNCDDKSRIPPGKHMFTLNVSQLRRSEE